MPTRSIGLFLLAAYLLILAVFPCQDHEASIGHAKVHALEQAQDHHEQDHDICSPFCICHCCGSLVMFTIPHSLQPMAEPGTDRRAIYFQTSLYQGPTGSIWQPPKVQG